MPASPAATQTSCVGTTVSRTHARVSSSVGSRGRYVISARAARKTSATAPASRGTARRIAAAGLRRELSALEAREVRSRAERGVRMGTADPVDDDPVTALAGEETHVGIAAERADDV